MRRPTSLCGQECKQTDRRRWIDSRTSTAQSRDSPTTSSSRKRQSKDSSSNSSVHFRIAYGTAEYAAANFDCDATRFDFQNCARFVGLLLNRLFLMRD